MPKFCQESVDSRSFANVSATLFAVTTVSLVSVNTEAGWLAVGEGMAC